MMWSEDTYPVPLKEHGAGLLHGSGGILRLQVAGTLPLFIPVKHVLKISFQHVLEISFPPSNPALKRTMDPIGHSFAAQSLLCTRSPGVRMCCSTRSWWCHWNWCSRIDLQELMKMRKMFFIALIKNKATGILLKKMNMFLTFWQDCAIFGMCAFLFS